MITTATIDSILKQKAADLLGGYAETTVYDAIRLYGRKEHRRGLGQVGRQARRC